MGFATTQKAKTAIIAALEEAGSSLEVSGKITGTADISDNVLNASNIPVKIVSGGGNANMDGNFTSIKVITSTTEYDNVYEFGPLFVGTYPNATEAWQQAETNGWICAGCNPYNGTNNPATTIGIAYWNNNQNDNTIVDSGEHLQVSIAFAADDRPSALDFFAVEVSPPKGAPMTVERTIPNINNVIVDLG